jgi:hypothetical protein
LKFKYIHQKLTLVVGGNGDCGDPENGKSEETNSGVEIEKVTIVDDSEKVAEGSNESEAKIIYESVLKNQILPSSSNEESMYPVAHDWLHVGCSRVEPKNEGEDCKEEADDCSKPGVVLFFPSLYEPNKSQNLKRPTIVLTYWRSSSR